MGGAYYVVIIGIYQGIRSYYFVVTLGQSITRAATRVAP